MSRHRSSRRALLVALGLGLVFTGSCSHPDTEHGGPQNNAGGSSPGTGGRALDRLVTVVCDGLRSRPS